MGIVTRLLPRPRNTYVLFFGCFLVLAFDNGGISDVLMDFSGVLFVFDLSDCVSRGCFLEWVAWGKVQSLSGYGGTFHWVTG